MSVSKYRLNAIGKIGAALFVLPTPFAAWKYSAALSAFAERGDFERTLESVQGKIALPELPTTLFVALATLTLIGFVMLLIGREIVTEA
ncbi:hypothetical protein B0E45_06175 [Sinorhizobium sp. A49]|uniref:hypothetical protein n=1 Tax=Sinorhizobium sp. A49 TaxID=1945861 RepID=UPI000984520D|nr:hypothetical protein [Sinorhizobium sp. A49]OOG73876.1 hypothetical protein B0E45_06175 [Sinorhizobium sp. A49]